MSFFDDCKKWNAWPDNEKSLDNFKTHILQEQNELQLQQQPAQTSGYASANAAQVQVQQDAVQWYQDAADALANPAMATSADRKAFENLSNTVANLTQQVKDKEAEIVSLKKKLTEHSNQNHNNNKHDQDSYCWTHGYLICAGCHYQAVLIQPHSHLNNSKNNLEVNLSKQSVNKHNSSLLLMIDSHHQQ